MEYWNAGFLETNYLVLLFEIVFPIIPSFHYSNIPELEITLLQRNQYDPLLLG